MPDGPVPAPLPPGSTIGILGSGQLGRMLAIAGARLGLKTHIYCEESGPAFDVAARTTKGSFSDRAALAEFAAAVDAVTYEFENVPIEAARHLAGLKPVRPGRQGAGGGAGQVDGEDLHRRARHSGRPFPADRRAGRSQDRAQGLRGTRHPEDAPARLRRQGTGEPEAERRYGRCLGVGWPAALRAREAHRLCARALGAGGARCRRRDGRLRLPGQHARRRHSAPLRRARRAAGGGPGAGPPDRGDASPRRSTTSACWRSRCSMPAERPGRRAADRQRDRAARAQLRPLDHRRLRGEPVREPHARGRRLAARHHGAPFATPRWST